MEGIINFIEMDLRLSTEKNIAQFVIKCMGPYQASSYVSFETNPRDLVAGLKVDEKLWDIDQIKDFREIITGTKCQGSQEYQNTSFNMGLCYCIS